MKKNLKLTLNRETLRSLDPIESDVNRSCVQSCFDMSCEGGCGLSEGATAER
jgi:hypothetical protein